MSREHPENSRGQVGIGTLIVFIAMVLVAAIAAGVLVNTAGFLQSSAQETGQKSSDQVTNRLSAVNGHGLLDTDESGEGAENRIDHLNVTLKRSPGSDDVDLDGLTVKYTSDTATATLTESSTLDASSFTVRELRDDDSSIGDGVLNADTDRVEVVVYPQAIEPGGDGLPPDSEVSLELTTESGATTTVTFSTPKSYASADPGDPLPLNI